MNIGSFRTISSMVEHGAYDMHHVGSTPHMVHVMNTGFKSEKVLFGFLDYHIFFTSEERIMYVRERTMFRTVDTQALWSRVCF